MLITKIQFLRRKSGFRIAGHIFYSNLLLLLFYYNLYYSASGINEIIDCIKEEINKKFPPLQALFEDNVKAVAGEMLAAGIITHHVAKNPSFSAIICGFLLWFLILGKHGGD